MTGYAAVYARSLRDPQGFWGEIAEEIDWTQRWERVLDDTAPPFYRWFTGAMLNTCHNALDRHVHAGRGAQAALIYDSPVTGTKRTFAYSELLDLVARFAGGLRRLGVEAGDRVVIYMPMVPEAVVAMLACARLGATHVVVFGGFGAPELASRIDDVDPKVIVSASCGIEPTRIVEYKPLLDERADPEGRLTSDYDLSSLRTLFVAGERCDADTLVWARERVGVPVIDHWWQTETGWAIAANPVGIEQLNVKPGSVTVTAPGYDLRVVDDDGQELEPGGVGNIVLRLPLPPGSLSTLWRNDDGYVSAYLEQFPGFYATGDGGYLDEDGYVWLLGRVDDVINVAGHRLSTGALEEAIASHPCVAECSVVGLPDELKGEVPGGFVVLKDGVDRDDAEVVAELVELVRERIGPVASFNDVRFVSRLPKTRSGKILRGTMRRLAEGAEAAPPPTIEDASALEDIVLALHDLGYPRDSQRQIGE